LTTSSGRPTWQVGAPRLPMNRVTPVPLSTGRSVLHGRPGLEQPGASIHGLAPPAPARPTFQGNFTVAPTQRMREDEGGPERTTPSHEARRPLSSHTIQLFPGNSARGDVFRGLYGRRGKDTGSACSAQGAARLSERRQSTLSPPLGLGARNPDRCASSPPPAKFVDNGRH